MTYSLRQGPLFRKRGSIRLVFLKMFCVCKSSRSHHLIVYEVEAHPGSSSKVGERRKRKRNKESGFEQ